MGTQIKLGEIVLDVTLKDIRNVHLSVYPPTGKVRISAPLRMSIDNVRAFAISKLGWIKQQQKKLRAQERETPREYLDRESHYGMGKTLPLEDDRVGRGPKSRAEAQHFAPAGPTGIEQREETNRVGRLVSAATQSGGSAIDRSMGAALGRKSDAVFCATHENQVGQL